MHTIQLSALAPLSLTRHETAAAPAGCASMELGKCISMLINATTDNEKMAALMIVSLAGAASCKALTLVKISQPSPSCDWSQVAKLIKADDIGAEGRRKVLDAVGFNFLNRLLATGE